MIRNRQNPLGALWQELNQVQDEFARWFGRNTRGPASPALNVWEDEQAVYAEADLPGLDPSRIEVTVTEGNQLTVQGERPAPEIAGAVWVRQERPFGKFVRVVGLPALVDASQVDAKYEFGVLRLTLPKHEAAKPRKILVKGESNSSPGDRYGCRRSLHIQESNPMSNLQPDTPRQAGAELETTEHALAVAPRVDVLETENEFMIVADVPGVRPEDVDMRFEKGELTFHARRPANREFGSTAYHRSFAVAESVAADKISADLKSGVLTIRLPKVEAVKPKRIAVGG